MAESAHPHNSDLHAPHGQVTVISGDCWSLAEFISQFVSFHLQELHLAFSGQLYGGKASQEVLKSLLKFRLSSSLQGNSMVACDDSR